MTRASDVLVVGGGAAGCAAAYYLAREGIPVSLFERGELAGQASGAAAGMLLPLAEAPGPGAFLSWSLRSLAMFAELAVELRERSGVDPEYEPSGALHLAETDAAAARLALRARDLAAHGAEWLDAAALRGAEPQLAPGIRAALWSPREGHVRSPLLVRALAGAAAALGGDRVVGVETSCGPRSGGAVVLCAGAWTPGLAGFALPIEPLRGQILSLEAPRPPLRSIAVAEDVYLVPKRDGSVVVGASEERVGFDRRVTAAGMRVLLERAPRIAPALAGCTFRGGWAGLRPATPDGLPAIGRAPGVSGLLVAAGHTRNGVLLAPVTGRLVTDLVMGKALPEDAAAFSPERFAG
jgi:glycine oxidase